MIPLPARRPALAALLAASLLLLVGPASGARAATAAAWTVTSLASPTTIVPDDQSGTQHYRIAVVNTGAGPSDGSPVAVLDSLPPGITLHATAVSGVDQFSHQPLACETSPLRCVYPGVLDPGDQLHIDIAVDTAASLPPEPLNAVTVSGGGAPPLSLEIPTPQGTVPSGFGASPGSFFAVPSLSQAGAHPDLTVSFDLAEATRGEPARNLRRLRVAIPPGLIGDPGALPTCDMAEVLTHACPTDAALGTVTFTIAREGHVFDPATTLLYNLVPYRDEPAALGFFPIYPARLDVGLRPDREYQVQTTLDNLTEADPVVQSLVTLWGVPADHNGPGPDSTSDGYFTFGGPGPGPRRPFLTNPSSCRGPRTAALELDSWPLRNDLGQLEPGLSDSATAPIDATTGCNQLHFDPSIEALPTTNQADSPSGLDFHLNIPQNEDPDGNATSTLRDATVTLPQGLTISSAQADGLGACSAAQIGLGSNDPATCPDASVVGSVKVKTPLLEEPLGGQVFLGTPDCAPCSPQDAEEGSLIHLYIQAEGSGVRVKLPGTGTIDPATGQITTSFEENPQLPFEDLELKLKQGNRAPLATPNTCGTFTTTSDLKPWSAPESGPDATPSSSFEVTGGPNGQPCPSGPRALHPGFATGTLSAQAGSTSPFTLRFTRGDGQAEITSLKTVLPPGLSAYLRGIPYCPDADIAKMARNSGTAEKANPSCPPASQIGTTTAGVGPGPSPFYVSGPVFLAGPYKGAPLSVVVDTPAVAGPFDLGTVAVRAALHLDPQSAQVTAVSDPIPTSLDGIPLRLRDDRIELTRPDFTLNPTDCDPLSVAGTLLGTQGAAATLSSPFQVSGCQGLPFKPKLALRLKGSVKRTANPKLIATLAAKPGEANIARAQVRLPKAAFLDNAHIGTVCTRAQFAAHACPPNSVYGRATAVTPLLDAPLTGNVYLESNPSHKLPDLVADLDGQIRVALAGKTDSVRAALRNTFEAVPDAPVSSFRLELFGGRRGLIEMSDGFCARPRASVKLTAHDNSVHDTEPVVASSCPHRKHQARSHRGGKR